MKPMRLSVIALVAMCAMSGTTAAAAVATEGEIVNSKGEALVKNHFTATSGAVIFESTSGLKVNCSSSTTSGTVKSKT